MTDITRAPTYQVAQFYRTFPIKVVRFWRSVFVGIGVVFILSVGVLSVLELINVSSGLSLSVLLGIGLITLPWGVTMLFLEIFLDSYYARPSLRPNATVAERLDLEAAQVILRAKENQPTGAISPDQIYLSLLQQTSLREIFFRIGIDAQAVAKDLEGKLTLPDASGVSIDEEMLRRADEVRLSHRGEHITALDILVTIFDLSDLFRQTIFDMNLDVTDLKHVADWYKHIRTFQQHRLEFWSLDNLLRRSPIGKDWVYGYSWYLTHFAQDLSGRFQHAPATLRLINRSKEIEQIEQVLARSGESNVLIVGEVGVGKRAIVDDLAELVARGEALPGLNYKKVFELNVPAIATSSKDLSDVQNLLTRILNETVKAGNIILVIENFQNFVGALEGMGRIDIAEVVLPYLRSSQLQIVATTDPVSFHKYIETRSALTDVFERVNVNEPSLEQTISIVQESLPRIEFQTGAFVTYGGLKEVVQSADKFIRSAPFPEKAFDLLTETISSVTAQKRSAVFAKDVQAVVSRKTGIPLGPIDGEEKDKLANLEELMRQELIGQERAIRVVASTMRRLRTGLSKRGRPAGVLLFVGPTGVGKTQTAKILAKTYFGAADKMLRFDMSEYQEIESLDRFLGSVRQDEPGQFTTLARDNPFALILLDEIEKANKNILNIFLQVFDEGSLTDAFGRKVNFEQHIIIATSNAGADVIRDLVNQGVDPALEKEKIVDVLIKGGSFSPEFLNRFDEVVIFHPLSGEQIYQVTEIAMQALVQRMTEQGYIYKPTEEITREVARAGFDPQFGARPIQRAIKDKVENAIAKKILDGSIRKGQEFTLSLSDLTA